MPDKLVGIVEKYFAALQDVHRLRAGTKELSYYPALAELLNALGQELKPKVLCLSGLGDTGAGHPDFGLFAANQVQKGEPRPGQAPERGVIEVKSAGDDAWLTADTAQVSKYFGAYRRHRHQYPRFSHHRGRTGWTARETRKLPPRH